MFNLMNLGKSNGKESNLSDELLSGILGSLPGMVPLNILLGLLIVLAYSFMIVSFQPILLMLYPYLNLFRDKTRDMFFKKFGPSPIYRFRIFQGNPLSVQSIRVIPI